MSFVDWRIKGRSFANCNCSYGCPCQFNALPTHGNCEAAIGYQIDEGHFGDVKLDGLRSAGLYSWPGAVHEGNGTMQLIVDESASAEHRVRIEMPHGFEYALAEIGSGTTKATGDIKLDYEASYGQFNDLHLTPTGPVRG